MESTRITWGSDKSSLGGKVLLWVNGGGNGGREMREDKPKSSMMQLIVV